MLQKDGNQKSLCLGCYFPAFDYQCSSCQVPLCGSACQNSSPHIQVQIKKLSFIYNGINWEAYSNRRGFKKNSNFNPHSKKGGGVVLF